MVRANVDRADWARRFIYERDNPDGLAPLVRAQSITDRRKGRIRPFRGMTGYRERATRIEIQARCVYGCSFGRASNRADWRPFGDNATIGDLNFAHAPARTRIVQHDFPRLRLRVSFHAGDRDNMIDEIAVQLCANHAQRVIGSGVFLRQHRRDQKQERTTRSPHRRN